MEFKVLGGSSDSFILLLVVYLWLKSYRDCQTSNLSFRPYAEQFSSVQPTCIGIYEALCYMIDILINKKCSLFTKFLPTFWNLPFLFSLTTILTFSLLPRFLPCPLLNTCCVPGSLSAVGKEKADNQFIWSILLKLLL